jgi:hypothetical protein
MRSRWLPTQPAAAHWHSLQVVVDEQQRADVSAHVSFAASPPGRAPVVAELQTGELAGEAAVDRGSEVLAALSPQTEIKLKSRVPGPPPALDEGCGGILQLVLPRCHDVQVGKCTERCYACSKA